MEAVAEGLWMLANDWEKKGEVGKAVKCLEAICQSKVSFLPTVEVKARLRIATILLKHTQNLNEAKSHLERSQLLLKNIPSCFDLKFRTYSLLSQCYNLVGAVPPQKQILNKAIQLTIDASSMATTYTDQVSVKLWCCNFNSQLAHALMMEGDYQNAIFGLQSGYLSATELCYPELQMFFATCILHVNLMLWEDQSLVEKALNTCDGVWETMPLEKREQCLGLLFYNEMLHVFYRLRTCDYKIASQHVDRLDAAVKDHSQKKAQTQDLIDELNALNQSLSISDLPYRERSTLSAKQAHLQERLENLTGQASSGPGSLDPTYFGNSVRPITDKIFLAPPPIDGEWLPKSAIYAMVDLMAVVVGRPKGAFKECAKRIQTGLHTIQAELVKLGITDGVTEVDLHNSAIWMAGVYLMLLMQFLENKVAIELTRAEFVEAQEALVQMKIWFIRFPTILQACESVIEMLRGQYAHSVGCYSEAAYHYIEAVKLTESKSVQAMCQIYAAVSYFCIGDSESSTQAFDLIGPIYRAKDSFVGFREEASVLFAYGLLSMKQQDLQEARNRLAKGLQIAHNNLGNLQLVSQYLTILGKLALALHDTSQAREILKSSLTLSKKLYDIPTQIWVLSILTELYRELGERGNEMENDEYRKRKLDDLQEKLAVARSSIYHIELIEKVRVQVQQINELDSKRTIEGQSVRINFDIPESVGLPAPAPVLSSSSRLSDLDARRRGKKKLYS